MSWTREGDDRGPRALAAALGAAGVPVWMDEGDIGAFDSITDKVRAGLAGSKVLVAWYSVEYPTRRACREELTLALLAAERLSEGPRRVLVVNPENGIGHVIEAPLLERLFAGRDDVSGLDELAARIKARLDVLDSPFGALTAPSVARWYGGAGWQSGSRRFVGRLAQLWQVHDRLYRTTGLVGPGAAGRAVAVVSGFGGVGKSLLAAEYAHLFGACYPGGVVWLSALGNDTTGAALPAERARAAANDQFSQVSAWLGLDVTGQDPDVVRERVKTELDRRGERVLWIVDDLPTGLTAAELDAWRCRASTVVELITTRDGNHTALDTIELDVLDPADAVALLTQDRSLEAADAHEAELLAGELGYHPLACDVAGLYIARGSTLADYRCLLAGRLDQFDELAAMLADQLPGGHAREITATLATSLQALGPDAWRLLRISTHLAAAAIPRALLLDAFQHVLALDDKSQGSRQAQLSVMRALGDPHADGLWRYDTATAAVAIHVLVRAAAAVLDPDPDQQAATAEATVIGLEAALTGFSDARRQTELALPAEHARYLLTSRVDKDLDAHTTDLLLRLGYYDWAGGRYDAALDENTRAHQWRRRVLGAEHPDTLTIANNVAVTLRSCGDYAGACTLLQATYDALLRLLGAEHADTLACASNLAESLSALGNHTGARALLQATYDTSRRVLGEEHPGTFTSAGNLANTLSALGDYAGARDLHQATYDGMRRLLGEEHPDTLACASNLAESLSALGDHAGARDLHQATYDACRRVLGEEHPGTLVSANNLGTTLSALGDHAGARDLHQATYDARRRVLGEEHPDTLLSVGNLAQALSELGDHAGARDLHQATYDPCRRVLGEEHPGTLASGNNLAAALSELGDHAGARDLHQATYDARRRVLGAEHPDTLITAGNLADALRALGDHAAARDLLQATYDARRRVLGEEHSQTMVSANNLGATLYALGDHVGARHLLQATYHTRRRLLGEEHPDTLLSATSLGETLSAQGDYARARNLLQAAHDIQLRVLGEEHPDTLLSAHNLATALRGLGDRAGSRYLLQATYDARRRVLGEEHPNTLITAQNLAVALSEAGDLGGARALLRTTHDLMQRILGADHFETVNCAQNLAAILYAVGDKAGARALLRPTDGAPAAGPPRRSRTRESRRQPRRVPRSRRTRRRA